MTYQSVVTKVISIVLITINITFSTSICFSQAHAERVDGLIVKSDNSYFNPTLKQRESAVNEYIGIYQKYISGIRGQECPMYPSCSNFGLKVFSETNFAMAFITTSDRLLRCGHDHSNYSLTLQSNGFKYLDYPAYDAPPSELYYKGNSYHFAYSDTIKDDSTVLFVKKLINNSYYQEALLEIMRIEWETNHFQLELFINKMICLKALEEYEKALFEYENKCPVEFKLNSELLYQVALIQYKLQNYKQSIEKNLLALETCNNDYCKPKIIMLNGLLFANQLEWNGALLSYESLQEFESHKQISIINSEIVKNAFQIKYKKPYVGGILSIIPGAGYLYTGHKQTAISAFLINGLLAYATYTSFKNENYGIALLTSVFNLSFYIGNIYGAAKSATRYNDKKTKSIISKLEYNTNL